MRIGQFSLLKNKNSNNSRGRVQPLGASQLILRNTGAPAKDTVSFGAPAVSIVSGRDMLRRGVVPGAKDLGALVRGLRDAHATVIMAGAGRNVGDGALREAEGVLRAVRSPQTM